MFAKDCWNTPLIAGDRVYVSDDDGEVSIFQLFPDPIKSVRMVNQQAIGVASAPWHKNSMNFAISTVPVTANGVLYIATQKFQAEIDPGQCRVSLCESRGPFAERKATLVSLAAE